MTVTSPASGASVPGGAVTITGTASDVGGVVGVVEISTNGGTTWRRAIGTANWSYTYTAAEGAADIRIRAADDSINLSTPITHAFNVKSRTCPCSIWNDTTLPDQANVTDNQPIEVGVRFRVDVDGYVTGLRFYKGNLNTGTHIAHLWTNTGIQLAEAISTDTNESASGWQEISLGSPVAVQADTTYVASYHSSGYFADNNSPYFTAGNAAAYTNPPVRAMTDGVDGSNAVFKYGDSAFPDQTWNQSNYWVDVVFNTSVGPDTIPPTVRSVIPASSATGIAVNTIATATFNEAMDGTTITDSTFELRDASSNLIPATVSYSSASRKATLTPNAALNPSTTYTATIKGGLTGVADVAGNKLAADYVWSFTTSAPPPLPQMRDRAVRFWSSPIQAIYQIRLEDITRKSCAPKDSTPIM